MMNKREKTMTHDEKQRKKHGNMMKNRGKTLKHDEQERKKTRKNDEEE